MGGVIRGVCSCGERGKSVPGEAGLGAGRGAGAGQVPACLPTASRDWEELGLCVCGGGGMPHFVNKILSPLFLKDMR